MWMEAPARGTWKSYLIHTVSAHLAERAHSDDKRDPVELRPITSRVELFKMPKPPQRKEGPSLSSTTCFYKEKPPVRGTELVRLNST